jgi:hypothetical protein
MVRQAHTYLAGAVSGTALIAMAVVAFVLLVSLQALRDWPLAGIAGGSESAPVSSGQPAAGSGATPSAAAGVGAAASAARPGANANARQRGDAPGESRRQVGAATLGTQPAPAPDSPAGEAPASNPDPAGGASPTTQSTSSSSGGNGGGADGGGNGPISLPGTGGSGSGSSTSGAVTGAVNNTVSGVDQTLGGALGDTGVTKVTEEVVSGVAGPESTVGETVDKAAETVDGLLGGKR